MGFFSNLFKPKSNKTISPITPNSQCQAQNLAKKNNLPEGIQKALVPPNPYSGKYKGSGTENTVHLLYCDFSTSYRWIQDAKKPEKYFKNYIEALQLLLELSTYSKCYKFRLPTPLEQLNELKNNYLKNTENFVNRFWNLTVEETQKLKTEKGKRNRIEKFFETLLNEYSQYLTQDNVDYINSFRKQSINRSVTTEKSKVDCGKYDVNSIESIKLIPNDPTIIRPLQKAATSHKRNGDLELAIECLKKSNIISDSIQHSDNKLLPDEYLRVIRYMQHLDSDVATKEENRIKEIHPEFWDKRITNRIRIEKNIKRYLSYNSDLVLVSSNNYCPICSKYHQKVFSISGKDTNYPKLPDEVKNQTHDCLTHPMSVLLYNKK